MKKCLSAVALTAALTQPATAITFPSLTTIYVGAGVTDAGTDHTGLATSFICTNVSGANATIRFLVLGIDGSVEGSVTLIASHGATVTTSTHFTVVFNYENPLFTGPVNQGAINIESTQSAVFCTATVVAAAGTIPAFSMDLHLVRVNPHPGTVE